MSIVRIAATAATVLLLLVGIIGCGGTPTADSGEIDLNTTADTRRYGRQ
jgi:hypothetical protein